MGEDGGSSPLSPLLQELAFVGSCRAWRLPLELKLELGVTAIPEIAAVCVLHFFHQDKLDPSRRYRVVEKLFRKNRWLLNSVEISFNWMGVSLNAGTQQPWSTMGFPIKNDHFGVEIGGVPPFKEPPN